MEWQLLYKNSDRIKRKAITVNTMRKVKLSFSGDDWSVSLIVEFWLFKKLVLKQGWFAPELKTKTLTHCF